MVPKPLGWSSQVQVSLLVIIIVVVSGSTASAQDDDDTPPYDAVATRQEFRNTAEAPVPFGVIVSGIATGLATPIGENHVETGHDAEAEIALYYDVWQVAWRHRPFGNVGQIMFRSVGRDTYTGWFVEYGPQTVVVESIETPNKDTTVESGAAGIGYRWARTLGSGRSIGWNIENSIVFLDRDIGILIRYGVSVRIPFGLSALTTSLQLRFSRYNWESARPSYVEDAQSQLGLALMVQYGLNSEY